MTIRGKPDIGGFRGLKRDPSAFLEGAEEKKAAPAPAVETAPEKKAVETTETAEAAAAVPRRQKLVELPEPILEALKDRAYKEFKEQKRRVTETEIIVAALKQYLNL